MARKKREQEPLEHALTDEELNIIGWRQTVLIQAGVNTRTAALLAGSLSIDLHETLKIKAKGCDDELLLEIMR